MGARLSESSTETDRYCYKQPIFFHDGVGFEGIKDGKAIYIDGKGSEALSASSGHDGGVALVDADRFTTDMPTIELAGRRICGPKQVTLAWVAPRHMVLSIKRAPS